MQEYTNKFLGGGNWSIISKHAAPLCAFNFLPRLSHRIAPPGFASIFQHKPRALKRVCCANYYAIERNSHAAPFRVPDGALCPKMWTLVRILPRGQCRKDNFTYAYTWTSIRIHTTVIPQAPLGKWHDRYIVSAIKTNDCANAFRNWIKRCIRIGVWCDLK